MLRGFASDILGTARYFEGFKNSCCGIDIGGTTAKLAVLVRHDDKNSKHVFTEEKFGRSCRRALEMETQAPTLGGTLHFIKWHTEHTAGSMEHLAEQRASSDSEIKTIYATGGGAHRFADLSLRSIGWEYKKLGEFDALVEGLRLIIDNMPDSIYCIHDGARVSANFCQHCFNSGRFPVLVCNIGTGVSMLKVAKDGAERIGGTSIGGSTFLGLAYQLTSARTFNEAIQLVREGDPREVDLLVADIYGENAEAILGIPGDITASSFGKLTRRKSSDSAPSESALAASACILVTQAIALYACQLARRHDCREVIFMGGFLEDNDLARNKLTDFVSLEYKRGEGIGRALFLKHSEYAGALGCVGRQVQEDLSFKVQRTATRRLNH